MTVLIRMVAPSMDTTAYDRVAEYLDKQVKKQPGFMMHVGYASPGGFFVEEVWQDQDQFDRWLNENVKPNVPDIQHEVIELHAVVQP